MDLPIDTRQETWAVRLATEQDAASETLSSLPWLAESASSRIIGYAYATTHSVRAATSVAICLRRTSRTRKLGLQREVLMRRLKKGAL
jgi:hypothetical protein